jgi:hypothetical protein
VRETERRSDHFSEKATTLPAAMKGAEVSNRLPLARKPVEKLQRLEPQIGTIIEYQQVLGLEAKVFPTFSSAQLSAEVAVRLCQAVQEWEIVSAEMLSKPFAAVAIADLSAKLTTIKKQLTELQSNAKINYPILNELVARVNEIFPYLMELEMLAKGKMQVRHWNALFDECQQPNEYHSQIAIGDLLSLGILKMREKIIRITATSQGESELEVKFAQITSTGIKCHCQSSNRRPGRRII